MSNRRRLSLACTVAEYDAAPPELQRDYDRRLLAKWKENAEAIEQRELQADYTQARDDQDWWTNVDTRGGRQYGTKED